MRAAALAVGQCATYGGIPAAKPDPTGSKGVMEFFKDNGIKTPVINIPGCAPHPDWMVGTIAHALMFGIPELDGDGRPNCSMVPSSTTTAPTALTMMSRSSPNLLEK